MAIGSLLVANRGEIAVRIIRAARALGIRTVQAHSAADADSLPVRMADDAVLIGPPPAAKSYLDIGAIIGAAKQKGVDAIHPGYGFLSENADFAAAVTEAGMIFIGPDAESIRLLGDKVAARKVARDAGVPTVPGSDGRISGVEEARALVRGIGFPVMIKAAAGGGGRGIRIVRDFAEFEKQFPQASSEAKAAFGDGGLYIEKVIENARHIEVQILGDGDNFIHCFERECSLQRRRQKVWEEAPAFGLSPAVRKALTESAVALARSVRYRGAGTVEYLYHPETENFYFIEVNTRIQVEHPVTEMITGIDLVAEMIRIAGGTPLSIRQENVRINGHAVECRINAEDPAANFMPSPGQVSGLVVPDGEGLRFDTMLYDGYWVPPFYDSLLGKMIAHGADRRSAIQRMREALATLSIGGIKTTIPLHMALVANPDVAEGAINTKYLEGWLAGAPLSKAATATENA
ncbi:acetyl-CoA carboxylase biotin carboxylase subunit [Chelativorans sp. AA-79]|uniref:acetyl-CoA carboxylase biotin carboxylase subunit n=1 Tax=Chelativorans sp. AA-79 TaxID=3028735 RepID=UPI0023F6A1E6|nr:acetyl-CoA carboxylase biotin carboxylase subunit [Chelativorans sp. AA-79]WEX07218.1 acetyl-CoA carboxylase biotin carboxylase subunit [Chelativorans sp. AA-79]